MVFSKIQIMSGFEDLRIYKLALEGCRLIYKITLKDPIKRDYSLVDQIKRAVMSIAANIAEAYGRFTTKDRSQFLTYAIGSCNEVVAFLDIIDTIYNINVSQEKEFFLSLGKQIFSFRKVLNQ